MKKTLQEIVQNAMDNKGPHAKLIQAIYWMAQSEGQESAECKIRENLHTLPMHRFYRVQAATIGTARPPKRVKLADLQKQS